jgi:hypothetical protein
VGQSWPRGTGSVGDSVGEGEHRAAASKSVATDSGGQTTTGAAYECKGGAAGPRSLGCIRKLHLHGRRQDAACGKQRQDAACGRQRPATAPVLDSTRPGRLASFRRRTSIRASCSPDAPRPCATSPPECCVCMTRPSGSVLACQSGAQAPRQLPPASLQKYLKPQIFVSWGGESGAPGRRLHATAGSNTHAAHTLAYTIAYRPCAPGPALAHRAVWASSGPQGCVGQSWPRGTGSVGCGAQGQ